MSAHKYQKHDCDRAGSSCYHSTDVSNTLWMELSKHLRKDYKQGLLSLLNIVTTFIDRYGVTRATVARTCVNSTIDNLAYVTDSRGSVRRYAYMWIRTTVGSLLRLVGQEFVQKFTADTFSHHIGSKGVYKYVVILLRHFIVFKDLFMLFNAYFRGRIAVSYVITVFLVAIVEAMTPLYVCVPFYIAIVHGRCILDELTKSTSTEV